MTFNIGQHAIGVTAATTRSFTIKVSSYNGTKLRGWGVQGDWIITQVNCTINGNLYFKKFR